MADASAPTAMEEEPVAAEGARTFDDIACGHGLDEEMHDEQPETNGADASAI